MSIQASSAASARRRSLRPPRASPRTPPPPLPARAAPAPAPGAPPCPPISPTPPARASSRRQGRSDLEEGRRSAGRRRAGRRSRADSRARGRGVPRALRARAPRAPAALAAAPVRPPPGHARCALRRAPRACASRPGGRGSRAPERATRPADAGRPRCRLPRRTAGGGRSPLRRGPATRRAARSSPAGAAGPSGEGELRPPGRIEERRVGEGEGCRRWAPPAAPPADSDSRDEQRLARPVGRRLGILVEVQASRPARTGFGVEAEERRGATRDARRSDQPGVELAARGVGGLAGVGGVDHVQAGAPAGEGAVEAGREGQREGERALLHEGLRDARRRGRPARGDRRAGPPAAHRPERTTICTGRPESSRAERLESALTKGSTPANRTSTGDTSCSSCAARPRQSSRSSQAS